MANAKDERFDGRSGADRRDFCESRHYRWSQGVVLSFSARRRTFGQDQSVAGVTQTFRQCCKANTCKLYQP